ncbi:MAG: NADH-quinone oxidoreductase subunit NuoK [Acidobacteria bacterium]|nr:NADH-quinone oxidoreductase subunit NuoK [Acidobacteriota bacterium]
MIPISHTLILSAILFGLGATGFLIRRNIITVFLCIELMLNGVALTFVTFSKLWGELSGHLFVFFIITVAAAEAAVGLAIIIAVFRSRGSLNIEEIDSMKF